MNTSESGLSQELTERLQTLSARLRELEKDIESGRRVDPVVLRDFREAVDNIRKTAWVVQTWIEKQSQKGDPYPLLPLLAEERIRRASELCRNLAGDLEAVEITVESEGLQELHEAVATLHKPLSHLYKKS
jgi:hypothetical protein